MRDQKTARSRFQVAVHRTALFNTFWKASLFDPGDSCSPWGVRLLRFSSNDQVTFALAARSGIAVNAAQLKTRPNSSSSQNQWFHYQAGLLISGFRAFNRLFAPDKLVIKQIGRVKENRERWKNEMSGNDSKSRQNGRAVRIKRDCKCPSDWCCTALHQVVIWNILKFSLYLTLSAQHF